TDLDTYLDDLDSGVLAPRTEIDPSIAAVASRIHQAGIRTAEPAGLRSQLWEDLMQNAPSIEAGSLAAPPLPRNTSNPAKINAETSTGWLGIPRPIGRSRPSHALIWMAAALVLLSVIGAGLIGSNRGNDPEPTTSALAPFFASPGASPQPREPTCADIVQNPFYQCSGAMDYLGSGSGWPSNYLDETTRNVQLQGWSVKAGATQAGAEAPTDSKGTVVDFVINGAYVATFTEQVMVSPQSATNEGIRYIDAGKPVELVRGDAVSYQLGSLVEIRNPLSVERLEFKRGLVYGGDISSMSSTDDGVTTAIEGDAMIQSGFNFAGVGNVRITLVYVHIPEGVTFPPSSWMGDAIIGPVDPQRGPASYEGFVLTVGRVEG
ncbi:MAG: hypothetical protein ACRDHN_17625, partial [Thermomicrobiales bacterium]